MDIRIVRRQNARRVTGRRSADGRITVTIPASMPEHDAMRMVKDIVEQFSRMPQTEWQPRFMPGNVIATDFGNISITTQSHRPLDISLSWSGGDWTIAIGNGLEAGTKNVDMMVNKGVVHIATKIANAYLPGELMVFCDELGVDIPAYRIGHGMKTLGTCSGEGVITLSAVVALLPAHLRRYIMCHELAHLTHMDHSAEFHALCNRYCGGREKQLQAEMKAYKWPIVR